MPADRPVIAIVDTSEDVASLLELIAQEAGGRTVTTYVPDLRRGQPDPESFLREHDPRVLLWDIALPYAENWDFFQQVQNSEAGRGRTYVLTTTNKDALEQFVGSAPAYELVGKPFDLEYLIATVRRALTDGVPMEHEQ